MAGYGRGRDAARLPWALAWAAAIIGAETALAAGTGLPWEGALETIQQSLTGPVALVVGILGIVVCGGMLVFGGDLQEFVRRILYLVLAVSLLMSATAVMTTLFGAGGAVI